MPIRLDSRGRRIGFNWWREHIKAVLLDAEHAWLAAREAACNGWQTEQDEWAVDNPRPTFKAYLIGCAGMNTEPEYTAA